MSTIIMPSDTKPIFTLPKPSVLTMGTFDLLHSGHIALFRECKKLVGPLGYVHVAVNSDEFVEKFKGHRPILSADDRMGLVAAVRYVDEVYLNDGDDQAAVIDQAKPDWLAVGVDWACRDYYGQLGITAAWLKERSISLAYLAHEQSVSISSTKIRERVVSGGRD